MKNEMDKKKYAIEEKVFARLSHAGMQQYKDNSQYTVKEVNVNPMN